MQEQLLKQTVAGYVQKALQAGRISQQGLLGTLEPAFMAAGYRRRMQGSIERLLVLRLDDIGDLVLTSGFLRELRRGHPQAQITLVVNPVVYPLVELCPYVNRILPFAAYRTALPDWLGEAADFCAQSLWPCRFDACWLPRWDLNLRFESLLAYLSGARERIGYSTQAHGRRSPLGDWLLTRPVVNPPRLVHEVGRMQFLLESQGLSVCSAAQELWLGAADLQRAAELLSGLPPAVRRIALAVCGSSGSKTYPQDLLLTVCRGIARERPTVFVLLGGKDAVETADWLACRLEAGQTVRLAGRTSLRESAAVIAQTQAYIGGDTGLKHMAAALGRPVLEINRESWQRSGSPLSFGERFFPWQVPAVSVRPAKPLPECEGFATCAGDEPHCITQITPQEVLQAWHALQSIAFRGK